MRIKEILHQHRRDFEAIFECEHCGFTEKKSGYDDAFFHNNVIPDMECPQCHRKADREKYRPLSTKYPEGMQV